MSKIKEKINSIPHFGKRFAMSVLGVLVCGISVGFFKKAAFGVDPFQTVMSGLDALIPISFGTLYVIANIVLLSFAFFADKHYIGVATVVNLTLLGYVAQFSLDTLNKLFPDMGMAGRVACLVFAVIVMCFASSVYFTADLGVSTYDAVSLIIANTWHIWKFKYVRITADIICVIIGSIMIRIASGSFNGITADVGVGTIITAFFMGPLIDFFNRKVSEPFLNR